MRRVIALAIWFVVLYGLWELLVGTFQHTERDAGYIAAGIGALFAETIRSLGLLEFRLDARTCVKVLRLVWQLPAEFCIATGVVALAIVRRRRVRGTWVRVRYPTASHALGRGQRALGTTVGTATPNAIVVDVAADGEALLHSLAPDLPGGREVL